MIKYHTDKITNIGYNLYVTYSKFADCNSLTMTTKQTILEYWEVTDEKIYRTIFISNTNYVFTKWMYQEEGYG